MSLEPYRLYVIYNVLKQHFNTKTYDIRKYGIAPGKRFRFENFEKDNFQTYYYATAKHYSSEEQAIAIISSNLVRDTKLIPLSIDFDLTLMWKYSKNKVTLIDDIKDEINAGLLTKIKTGDIIKPIISGDITPELLAYISRLVPIQRLITETTKDKYMWDIINTRIDKMIPFCRFESTEQLKLLTDVTKKLLSNRG